MLPKPPDLGLLIVRTDYSDDQASREALIDATAVHEADDFERGGALLVPVESPALAGLTPKDLVALPRDDDIHEIAVADTQTMRDRTILFVDLNPFHQKLGRTFRAVPSEVEPVVANLSIANMSFAEFADHTDPHGIFRGF